MSIISLAPREAATFPYKRFQTSPLIGHSLRKLASLQIVLGNQYQAYRQHSGMSPELGEQATFDQLFTHLSQLSEYLTRYLRVAEESTLHSIKTTLEFIEDDIKEFEMHSVEHLRIFVNKLTRMLNTYHRSQDVSGYLVDISGTYSFTDKGISEIEVYVSKQDALSLLEQEGDDSSKMYSVYANIVSKGREGSRKVTDGLWLLKSKDIFHCSQCSL